MDALPALIDNMTRSADHKDKILNICLINLTICLLKVDGEIEDDDCDGNGFESEKESRPNRCSVVLDVNEKKGKINKQLKSIIKSNTNLSNSREELLKLFTENLIPIGDARQCKLLFQLFLEQSGNYLLLELIKDGDNKGRKGNSKNLEIFKTAW